MAGLGTVAFTVGLLALVSPVIAGLVAELFKRHSEALEAAYQAYRATWKNWN